MQFLFAHIFFKSSSQFKASNDDLGSASIQYHKIVSVSSGFATKCHWVGNNVSSRVNLFCSRKIECCKANIMFWKISKALEYYQLLMFNNIKSYLKVYRNSYKMLVSNWACCNLFLHGMNWKSS